MLALLDALLCRAALIVEGHDPLGRPGKVGYDESDPWIKFARMPLDLCDDTAGLGPTRGPVAEVRVVSAHVLWRPADRVLQQMDDIALKDSVCRQIAAR